MRTTTLLSAMVLVALAQMANADVLELKNGQVLTGKYVGGTAGTIRFETGAGVQVIEASQALALTFTESGAASTPASAPVAPAVAVPTPATAPGSVTIPSGTMLLVRMADGASSRDSKR